MRVSIVGALVAATLSSWGLEAPAYAAVPVAYVSADGVDGGDCGSAGAACATVTYALGQVAGDATIKVSGTVHDNVQAVPPSVDSLTITGADAPMDAPAVLDGSGAGTVIFADVPLTIDHLTIRNGNGISTGLRGGGISADGGDLTIRDSTITGNTALSGGAVYAWYSQVVIVDSVISNNASSNGGSAGGVYAGHGSMSVLRSTLTGNNAAVTGNGGAIYMYDESPLSVVDSTISGNTAASYGGGISSQNVTVRNSTIADNAAAFGGALYNPSGTATILTSTVSGNSGDSIYNSYGTLRIGASIVGPNSGPNCIGSSGAYVSLGYNLSSDSTCGLGATSDLTGVSPALGALADNGGGTLTLRPDQASPAVGQIPVGTMIDGIQVCDRDDQRGIAGPVAGATACTIGAVEPADWALREQGPLMVTSADGTAGTPLALTVSGGSGSGAVSYAVVDGTASGCVVGDEPAQLTAATSGTCVVTASKAGDDRYLAVSSAGTSVTFAAAAQAPLVVTSTSGTAATPLPFSSTGGSGAGAVSYAVVAGGTASGCVVGGTPAQLTATSSGTCVVKASKAEDGVYAAVSSAETSVTFAKAVQAPLVVATTTGTVGSPLTLAVSGGSGSGAVSYAVVAGGTASGCAVGGTPRQLTATASGTCLVTATKAGDGVYVEVSSVGTSVTFAKAVQEPLVVTSTNGTAGMPLALAVSGGSGAGAVSYAVVAGGTATGCAISSGVLTSSGAGTCLVTATKAADAQYLTTISATTIVHLAAPATVPGAVRSLRVSGKPSAARRVVTWKAPTTSGGMAVTAYRVVVMKGSRTVYSATVRTTRATLRAKKLGRGKRHVRVRAVNSVGAGRAASVSLTIGRKKVK